MLPELIPLRPNRVWRTYTGGRTLDEIEGKPFPEDGHFPEDWIGSTILAANPKHRHVPDEGLSLVDLGSELVSLKALTEKFPEEALGRQHCRRFGATTQFLLKLLDSAIRLHLQCHPTVSFARTHLNSESGKTEAYIILGTRPEIPEPSIWLGFQRPPSRERLKKAVEAQDTSFLLSCFDKIRVQAGDVFIVPGGLPHAIGEGVFMIEVMEPTDFVVRLEFERGGYVLPEEARFMARDVDFALSMIDFGRISAEEARDRLFISPRPLPCRAQGVEESQLIGPENTDRFSVRRLRINGAARLTSPCFFLAVVTGGHGEVLGPCGGRWPVRKYDRFFVPFATKELTYRSDNQMEVCQFLPPSSSS